jgi:hypothetical protein
MTRTIENVMEKVKLANKNSDNYEDWLDHEDIQCLLDELELLKRRCVSNCIQE